MKNKSMLMAMLIFACATALHAREIFINTVDSKNPPTETADLINPSWIDLQQIGSKNLTVTIEIPDIYQLIHLSKKHHPPIETNGDLVKSSTQVTQAKASLFDSFTGNDLDWLLKPTDANKTSKGASSNKKLVQVIFIEPLNDLEGPSTIGTRVYENRFSTIQPQPAWYKWIKPELFLIKWAEYWFTESTAEWEEHYWFSESNAPNLNTVDLLCFTY
jgi:hypothetical protein